MRNPTTARSSAIADAASRMPAERSSAASTGACPLGGDHVVPGELPGQNGGAGRRSARENATVACGPMSWRIERRDGGGEPDDAGEQAELGVGLDQLLVGAHQVGTSALLDTA